MMPSSMTLTAPAKINLSLRLLGKRTDGYHEIETLIAPITLADEVEINHLHGSPSDTITLTCNDPTLSCEEDNLCVKAARAFQEASGIQEAIAITLLKRIPHGAGLGGGSSDAAVVLRGMNQLFNEPLVLEELHYVAASLGSDIPFFIEGKPAWCRGRGEVLTEATSLPAWPLLLIKPPFSIATAWAYEAYQRWTQDVQHQKTTSESRSIVVDDVTITNDLELPVFQKYVLLPVLREWLQKRPEVVTAWMTGSGSTMVALLDKKITRDQVEMLQQAAAAEFGETFWMKETTFHRT